MPLSVSFCEPLFALCVAPLWLYVVANASLTCLLCGRPIWVDWKCVMFVFWCVKINMFETAMLVVFVCRFVLTCVSFVLVSCGHTSLQTLLWRVFCVAKLLGWFRNLPCLCSGASKTACSKPPCWLHGRTNNRPPLHRKSGAKCGIWLHEHALAFSKQSVQDLGSSEQNRSTGPLPPFMRPKSFKPWTSLTRCAATLHAVFIVATVKIKQWKCRT